VGLDSDLEEEEDWDAEATKEVMAVVVAVA
jgi:hypothetical protein